jgi:hypothetical protein
MSRGMKGVIVLHPPSLYEVFIEGTEYDDTFHTSAHYDLIV